MLPDGEHVDNCQHVTLGCCTNLDDFYRRVGSTNKVKFFDRLLFLDPQGRKGEMEAGFLPAPFHMTGSFAKFAPLSLADKISIGRAMLSILRTSGRPSGPAGLNSPEGISMLEWLKQQRQTQRAIDRFWRVVLVSALDEELDKTDARFGIDVFWKAFLANSRGYRMGVPIVPLAELYDGCRAFVEKQGGEVTLRSAVRGIKIENNSIAAVSFDNNREESADAYVFAIPHDKFGELLPPQIAQGDPTFRNIDKIKDSPITASTSGSTVKSPLSLSSSRSSTPLSNGCSTRPPSSAQPQHQAPEQTVTQQTPRPQPLSNTSSSSSAPPTISSKSPARRSSISASKKSARPSQPRAKRTL